MTRKQMEKTVRRQFMKENCRWIFENGTYHVEMGFFLKDISMTCKLTNNGNQIDLEKIRVRLFRTPIEPRMQETAQFVGENLIEQIIDWIVEYLSEVLYRYASLFERIAEMRQESDRAAAQLILNY